MCYLCARFIPRKSGDVPHPHTNWAPLIGLMTVAIRISAASAVALIERWRKSPNWPIYSSRADRRRSRDSFMSSLLSRAYYMRSVIRCKKRRPSHLHIYVAHPLLFGPSEMLPYNEGLEQPQTYTRKPIQRPPCAGALFGSSPGPGHRLERPGCSPGSAFSTNRCIGKFQE